jgi:hypothetical protein
MMLRTLLISLPVAATIALQTGNTTPGNVSVVTPLDVNSCEVVDLSEEEAYSTWSCPGPGGYSLLVHDSDARQSIDIVAPDGSEFPLDYWSVITQGFSSVGWEAEWRLGPDAAGGVPVALIVRVNASEWRDDIEDVPVSYLAVARITPELTCVTDSLTPAYHQMDRARAVADASAGRPCLASVQAADTMLAAGRYCYRIDSDVLSSEVLIDVDAGGSLRGRAESVVHDEANSYYTSYTQKIAGFGRAATTEGARALLAGVDVTTWIEYDVQTTQESWTISAAQLDAGLQVYPAAACDSDFGVRYAEELLGIEETPTDIREVAIEPSASVTLSNSVVRGYRDRYVVELPAGGALDLRISSLEENAVFDVIDPSGTLLLRESMQEQVYLPYEGRYEIIVGGTRGNASYDLVVTLR